MLYQAYAMQRAGLAPLRLMASGTLSLLDFPFNPFRPTPAGRIAAAALDAFEHSTRDFGKPAFGHASTRIGNEDVAVEEEIVAERAWCVL